jgi:hypothetical protein
MEPQNCLCVFTKNPSDVLKNEKIPLPNLSGEFNFIRVIPYNEEYKGDWDGLSMHHRYALN